MAAPTEIANNTATEVQLKLHFNQCPERFRLAARSAEQNEAVKSQKQNRALADNSGWTNTTQGRIQRTVRFVVAGDS